jgi:hypothetical protein
VDEGMKKTERERETVYEKVLKIDYDFLYLIITLNSLYYSIVIITITIISINPHTMRMSTFISFKLSKNTKQAKDIEKERQRVREREMERNCPMNFAIMKWILNEDT